MMSAYAIGRVHIRDRSWMSEYATKLRPILAKHGGRFLVAGGNMEAIEGSTSLPTAIVVIEFPSFEHARAWYDDPDYAPLIKLRQSGSDFDLVFVEGATVRSD